MLPGEPLRQWVLSVPFPLRYLFATDPVPMGAVLGVVYRALAAHLVRKAGLTRAAAQTGAVTLIQRFGSALNLNLHFHLLVLDGVYEVTAAGPRCRRVAPPASAEIEALLGRIGFHPLSMTLKWVRRSASPVWAMTTIAAGRINEMSQ